MDPNYSDARVAGGASWTLPLSTLLRATLGGKFSYEDDFYSATVSAALERDFNQKNTTVSLGINSENDFLQLIGGAPTPLSDYSLFEKNGRESKHGVGLLAGITQIMTRNWITLANLSVDRFSGYLNDPYKIVSVVNPTGDPVSYVYENRPDSRTRRSVYWENRAGWSRGAVTAELRYMTDSWGIHAQRGTWVRVDEETASLLDFALQCFQMTEGLFDITSGILRQVWKFDGSDRLPMPSAVAALLPLIGFDKLSWQAPWLRVPSGMELDFGGIGKEYAVDETYDLLIARCPVPFLVNFGGDLRVSRPLPEGPWKIGIERPDTQLEASMMLEVEYGALATSGDSHRFLLRSGVRYGHVLDPRTGWPVPGAPRSVTVAASSCTEAGLLSTVAMLKGSGAREFLEQEQVRYWLLG